MKLTATFPTSGTFRKCTSDLPGMFYRTRSRPELVIATHRNAIKAWGGSGILGITHINGTPVKFRHVATYPTFNRYAAEYDPAELQSLVTAAPAAQPVAPKPEKPKPKRKRTSYAEKVRRREEWLSRQTTPLPEPQPESDSDTIDLDISWYDNRYGVRNGILFHGEGMAHVRVAYQTLWGRSDINWRTLNVQRHPEPIPEGLSWRKRFNLPGFLARLEGKYVAIKGIYVGKFETSLVPGWPVKGKTKYGMKKLTCVMANEKKVRDMIDREVNYTAPERLGRLRGHADAHDYDGYKKELEVQA